jgi:hypothetical protein
VHPHIFNFIELLRKVNDAIEENLELLLNDYKGRLIPHMQLAIKCRRALTTKLAK